MTPTSLSNKKYVIHSRQSKFTGKGESIENQIELCREYIVTHFGEDFATSALVYEDEGCRGVLRCELGTDAHICAKRHYAVGKRLRQKVSKAHEIS